MSVRDATSINTLEKPMSQKREAQYHLNYDKNVKLKKVCNNCVLLEPKYRCFIVPLKYNHFEL